ncbi:MAG: DUF2125 domain-containing protein [Alphaproteobacteria bacterium]|nr:MAG: DUF2125 domain-containing protein [Alphaproteobacteria bacterium]
MHSILSRHRYMTVAEREAMGAGMKARIVIAALLAGVAGWSGWWLYGASAQKAALAGWLEERRNAGWVAEAAEISVSGFPSRFDSFITGLSLADPEAGWAWDAEEFQILRLVYKPDRYILAWPGEQRLATPHGAALFSAPLLRASARFVPDTDLSPEELVLETSDLKAVATAGWESTAKRLVVGLRRSAPGTAPDEPYDLGITGEAVTLPPPLLARLDPAGLLATRIDRLKLDATFAFDAVWDRKAVEGRKPALTALAIRAADMRWGKLRLAARGTVRIDDEGYPVGEIDISAHNWRRMLKTAVAAGVMGQEIADALETGLSVIAALSGDDSTLDATLSFADGEMSLGLVPLGPAPRFRIPQRPEE